MSAATNRMALLRAELTRDWEVVERHLERAVTSDPSEDPAKAAFVALALDHAYQAFETLLVRLERALELPARSGGDWHSAVLTDAALELPGVRPAILTADAVLHWNHLRRFRHFLRHAYAVDLDPEHLSNNVRHLRDAVTETAAPLRALIDALA